ncbi:GNAT family N-acetyltransferase [Phyllobacterium zundukense]|uniref:GNAT family N-acetyltransferase n=1 Tax=Phyllobacterium zundukense TaxID=1867719 RepID=A0A2N9VPR0_9HYPH|nr:GNAT family N-acetyltransferase [Phyllobacterium zundukense]ATU94729.1 GNAT family N-acetyltransferase [Phyllobacterium zundukense]PIO41478.1 GNAT family N-acetyltransferase [Phyllobacterium zundukense]
MAVAIRQATIDDAALLHQAILKLAESMDAVERVKSTPDALRRHGFGGDPAFEALIAEIDGAFAGMCLYFPSFSTWRGKPGIYVQDIFVEERFRGRKIGERLLQAAAERGLAKGAAYLRLSVEADNHGAQGFYTHLGIEWSRSERIHGIYGDAFAALAEQKIEQERS